MSQKQPSDSWSSLSFTDREISELLQAARTDVTMDVEAVRNKMKKDIIRKIHPYSICYKPSNGRWVTYVIIEGKKKAVTRKNEKDLYNYLEELYSEHLGITLSSVYQEWIRGRMIDVPATASKDQWIWKKYLQDHPITEKSISDINVEDIKDYLRQVCIKNELTGRKATEIKTLLNLVFDYAVEKEYCRDNKSRRIRNLSRLAFIAPETQKEDEEERFTVEEATAVCSKAIEYYHKTDNSLYLAIPLSFQIGVRSGEMVAIQFGDIEEGILTLQRSEIKAYSVNDNGIKKNGFQIVDRLKKGKKSRVIPLTESALSVIEMIRSHNLAHGLGTGAKDFLFQRQDGTPHHTNDLHKAQNRVCEHATVNGKPIGHKSFHKIRKTWVSTLLTFKALPVTTVRDLAGHSDARMTLNVYGKTMVPQEKVRKEMEEALPDFHTLTG